MVKKRQVLTKPIITESPGGVKLDWYHDQEMVLGASVEYLNESSRGIFGEFNFTHLFDEFPPIKHLHFNLQNTKARQDIVRRLEALSLPVDFNWLSLVDQVCDIAIDSLRKETPIENINIEPFSRGTNYLLYPLLVRGQPNTIYGTGGFGKSILADYIAVLVQFGIAGLDWVVEPGNVLYLDWETDVDTHRRRIKAMKKGLDITDTDEIMYRFCDHDLIDEIDSIRKVVADKKVELVIVDSQMAATSNPRPGLDASQEASAFYNALRTLQCTVLIIDHITKLGMSENSGTDTAYGSVVKYNRTRNQFFVRRTQEPGDTFIEMALVHKKFNDGRLQKPFGLRIDFTEIETDVLDTIVIGKCDLEDNAILSKQLPLWQRIQGEMKYANGAMELKDIAEAVEASEATVRTTLNRMSKVFVKVGKAQWGLVSKSEEV